MATNDYLAQRRARRDAEDEDDFLAESTEDEEEEEEEEDVDVDDDGQQGPVRVPRVLWERCNPLEHYNDVDFHRNFRFTKENLKKVVDLIKEDLQFDSKRGCPLDPVQQTCLLLTFFASGSFQHVSAYMAGVKKSTACVTIRRVAKALVAKSARLISMPTREEMRASSEKLFEKFNIPSCPLGVDGTHIRLVTLRFVLFHFVPGHFVPVVLSPGHFVTGHFVPWSSRPLVISSPLVTSSTSIPQLPLM
jgi:hypothetical protein